MTLHERAHAIVLFTMVLLTPPVHAQKPSSGQPWLAMDYGPFLTHAFDLPGDGENVANKGILVRLCDEEGREEDERLVFDPDLLRVGAAIDEAYVQLHGVTFDGAHNANPALRGRSVLSNPIVPGWSDRETFVDPRVRPWGPIPREHGHYEGLYLHGKRVVFAYTARGTRLLESHAITAEDDVRALTRVFQARTVMDEPRWIQVATEHIGTPHAYAAGEFTQADTWVPADRILWLGEVTESNGPTRPDEDRLPSRGLLARWTFAADERPERATQGTGRMELRNVTTCPGREGAGALLFQGRSEVRLREVERLDPSGHDLTVALWVRPNGDGTLFSRAAEDGPWIRDGMTFFIRGGRLAFDVGWVGAVQARDPLPMGRTSHVAFTWRAQDGRVELYQNGKRVAEKALPLRGAEGPKQVTRLGFTAENFPSPAQFSGAMEDVRIYGRVLAPEEFRLPDTESPVRGALALGIRNPPTGARWHLAEDGNVRLHIPRLRAGDQFEILAWRGPREGLATFEQLATRPSRLPALDTLTHGGPARWKAILETQGELGPDERPYAIDRLHAPQDNPWHSWLRFGGFDFFGDDSRAALSTWNGDVWIVTGIDRDLKHLRWQRVATGLFEPLGLAIRDDDVFTVGRDQITRFHDLNGDGEFDYYENFNNDHENTKHFHEFALDLELAPDGSFYYMKGARHAKDSLVPQHGTLRWVSADGSTSRNVANGFRAPNGLALGEPGVFYSTDQQGHWMPANRLNRIVPGKFYGNMYSFHEGERPTTYDPPMCWIHPSIDRSPADMIRVTSERWGPFENRLLEVSYGMGKLFVVMEDEVHGQVQAAITPIPLEFETGIMRSHFRASDGQLYLAGLFGWAGNKSHPGMFYRVRRTETPVRSPRSFHVLRDGLVIEFTDPLDPVSAQDVGSYSFESWNYRWTSSYGSKDFRADGEPGRDSHAIESAELSPDGRTVFLRVVDLKPTMQAHLQVSVRAADGEMIKTFVHHTIHALGAASGAEFLGWVSRPSGEVESGETDEVFETGLKLGFHTRTGSPDGRRVRLMALSVPEDESPTPFIPNLRGRGLEPFHAFFEANLLVPVTDLYRFTFRGRGEVNFHVNGVYWLEGTELTEEGVKTPPIQLRGGSNAVRLEFTSPPRGDARVRAFWSREDLREEPIPSTAFSPREWKGWNRPRVGQEDEAVEPKASGFDLSEDTARRVARQKLANALCVRCHVVEEVPTRMPELSQEAPSLVALGSRLRGEWIERWLLEPRSWNEDARMPSMLHGDAATRSRDARDIATWLTQGQGAPQAPSWLSDEQRIARGNEAHDVLGCNACHRFADESPLPQDDRRLHGDLSTKWHPEALAAFLENPQGHAPWTRMPNFGLAREQAEELAAFLWRRTAHETRSGVDFAPGDASHGRELVIATNCAACHTIDGVPKARTQKPLQDVGGVTRGCLAETRPTGSPDYDFTPEERSQLSTFLAFHQASLYRTSWPEYATRQREALRCSACHELDGATDTWSLLEARVEPEEDLLFADPAAERTVHSGRPALTWAGEQFRPSWLREFLHGDVPYEPRPHLEAKMPAFPRFAAGLARGFAEEHGVARDDEDRGPMDAADVPIGAQLVTPEGFSCLQCHPRGETRALAGPDTETIDLRHIADRLRHAYYTRFTWDPQRVRPGTMMPRFVTEDGVSAHPDVLNGDAVRQLDAIWSYLRSIEERRR